jgi:hypothetical protein
MNNTSMPTIQIDTGEKRVQITRNGQPAGELVFSPSDILFAERFYALLDELNIKLIEYRKLQEQFKPTNPNELPSDMTERIALQRDLCEYMREKIDHIFGNDTSQTVFGDVRNLDVYKQFFDGILPFFKQVRAERIAQYTTPASAKRNKRKK